MGVRLGSFHQPHSVTVAANAYLVVNVDTDPDPVSVYQDDASILAKYARMRQIIDQHVGGAAAYCVLTGPVCRSRFFEAPFLDVWQGVKEGGGDLVLHPEEDLYGPPPGKQGDRSSYENIAHMEPIILGKAADMRARGLAFAAYRGGYHGFTPAIGRVVRKAGILIDLSCAPRIVWPEKAAAWADAPLSAYYMSPETCDQRAAPDHANALFEIPFAWDGIVPGTSRRFVIGENYIINEFSNFLAMAKVWDAIIARRDKTNRSQIVSMVCHTFSMGQENFERQLADILSYVVTHGGHPVTPTQAKQIYDDERAAGAGSRSAS